MTTKPCDCDYCHHRTDGTTCDCGHADGEVWLSEHHDPATGRISVRIDRADPRARIAADFVINVGETRPPYLAFTNPGVLVISDDYGQRFTYRVDFDDYDQNTRSFGMEWPD